MFLAVVSSSARVGRKCLKSQVRVVRIVNWYWLVFKLLNKSFFTLPHDFYSYLMVSNLLNQPVQ
jgi:hypothetical protein